MMTFDRLPLTGVCRAFRPPGHPEHVIDIIGLDQALLGPAEVSLWRALGALGADRFAGWSRQVVAPVDAVVVSVHDGEPDRRTVAFLRDLPKTLLIKPLLAGNDVEAMAGNHLILETGDGFMLLAHLRRDSLAVVEGTAVSAGTLLGEVGNSGNTLFPHLHVQTMTSSDPLSAQVLPWQVTQLEVYRNKAWRAAPGTVPLRTPIRSR